MSDHEFPDTDEPTVAQWHELKDALSYGMSKGYLSLDGDQAAMCYQAVREYAEIRQAEALAGELPVVKLFPIPLKRLIAGSRVLWLDPDGECARVVQMQSVKLVGDEGAQITEPDGSSVGMMEGEVFGIPPWPNTQSVRALEGTPAAQAKMLLEAFLRDPDVRALEDVLHESIQLLGGR